MDKEKAMREGNPPEGFKDLQINRPENPEDKMGEVSNPTRTLQVTSKDGIVANIEDPRDIGDFLTGKGIVYGIDPINKHEKNINH